MRCYQRGRIKTNAHLNVPSQNAVDNLWTSKIALASQIRINEKTTAKVSPSRKILHLILPNSPKALSRKSQFYSGLTGTHTHTHTPQLPLTTPPTPSHKPPNTARAEISPSATPPPSASQSSPSDPPPWPPRPRHSWPVAWWCGAGLGCPGWFGLGG